MAHKNLKAKYISFIIVPEKGGEPRNYHIRKNLLRLALVGGIVLLVLIIIGASTYWKVASLALENNSLREENFKLSKSLGQMESIKEELQAVKSYQKKLRSSLDGYITIDKLKDTDSIMAQKINFAGMPTEKRETIFRNIPSMMPLQGFIARGFDASSLINEAHLGVDVAAPSGSAVKAPADGVVMFSGWTVDGGNVLIIYHGYGFMTLYKHNERNLVNRLERVNKGQVIALSGNTGKITSGPHLHIEVWKDGLPVDPLTYIMETNKLHS